MNPRWIIPCLLFSTLSFAQSARIEIGWPTPNPAYFEGKPIDAFIQPTASGEIESGLYGCRRSGGSQFHEGLDLKPVKRDRHGEPADPIFAAMDGVVRHINRNAGDSNYGRYIVLEHPGVTPAVYTLYAHLAAIEPGVKVGDPVTRGQTIALMGRSASGYAIPRDRAHMHFEIGLWLSRDFQRWYDWKKFGSRNDHGVWNGMNLMGIDPLEFFNQYRARQVDTFQDFFAHVPEAVCVRIAYRATPDFAERYPTLVTGKLPMGSLVSGWEVRFDAMGVPISLRPLPAMEMAGYSENEVRVIRTDEAILRQHRCKSLVLSRHDRTLLGRDLEPVLQLLFGVYRQL